MELFWVDDNSICLSFSWEQYTFWIKLLIDFLFDCSSLGKCQKLKSRLENILTLSKQTMSRYILWQIFFLHTQTLNQFRCHSVGRGHYILDWGVRDPSWCRKITIGSDIERVKISPHYNNSTNKTTSLGCLGIYLPLLQLLSGI